MRQKVLSLIEKYLGRGHFSGDENVSVRCPFHKGGKESRPSFSVNVGNGVWQCFTCKVAGSLPKLLRSLGLPSHVIDAELKDIRYELSDNQKWLKRQKQAKWQAKDPFITPVILPETVLKPYEWCPISLLQAGFDEAWLKWLDIGFDKENHRIIYPIRDMYGNLAGVSGGAVTSGIYPKYKVYLGRRNVWDQYTGKQIEIGSDYGPWFDELFPTYEFHNHNYLWNFDQVYPRLFFGKETQDLIIVEGFKACIWLLQHGWLNTVALMGSSMSDHQRNLIHRLDCKIILFLDNDLAGIDATDIIGSKLRQFQSRVHIAQYPTADECQPDNLDPFELMAAIQGAELYPTWKRRTRYVNGRTKKRRFESKSGKK